MVEIPYRFDPDHRHHVAKRRNEQALAVRQGPSFYRWNMLVNTGLRTDLVACYSDWLLKRFEEGYVFVRNPVFPNKISRYELTPENIDAVLFRSKNYAPILPRLHEITGRFRTYFTYTITAYGSDLEPNIPSTEESIEHLKELSRAVGKDRLSWRYDPVLLTPDYPVERHIEAFARIAERVAPHVNGCVYSFVEMLVFLRKRMPELIPLTPMDKATLSREFTRIARTHGIPIRNCHVNGTEGGRGCVTLGDIGAANNCAYRSIKHTGNRRGCACIESRDLGWYNTCPLGCKYCGANRDPASLKANLTGHDPLSPLLIGYPGEGDDILFHVYDTLLKHDGRQMSLFDL